MQLKMSFVPEEFTRRHNSRPAPKQMTMPAAPSSKQPVKPALKRPRQPVSQPVDADDLRRRLYVVVSQREAAKEKRRQARVEETVRLAREAGVTAAENGDVSAESPNTRTNDTQTSQTLQRPDETQQEQSKERRPSEPYVPQQAASQFARTATAQGLKDKSRFHELSYGALKMHTVGHAGDNLALGAAKTPAGQGRALRKVQSERERLHDRNQFQNTRILNESEEAEAMRRSKQRQTIPNEHMKDVIAARSFNMRHSVQCNERETTRIVELDECVSGETVTYPIVHPVVDWTQSDEIQERRRGMRSPLLLRKADSLWGLKERLGKHEHESIATLDLKEKVDAAVPKPIKKSFWNKFRGHIAAVHA
ncbi:hypothetical protein SCUP515_09268 [Seiridium cupressi]